MFPIPPPGTSLSVHPRVHHPPQSRGILIVVSHGTSTQPRYPLHASHSSAWPGVAWPVHFGKLLATISNKAGRVPMGGTRATASARGDGAWSMAHGSPGPEQKAKGTTLLRTLAPPSYPVQKILSVDPQSSWPQSVLLQVLVPLYLPEIISASTQVPVRTTAVYGVQG